MKFSVFETLKTEDYSLFLWQGVDAILYVPTIISLRTYTSTYTRTVYVQCVYSSCTVCVNSVFTVCVQCVYSVCTVCVQCVYSVCTVCVQCVQCVYSVCTVCVLYTCMLVLVIV
jgi:hypothetical protein